MALSASTTSRYRRELIEIRQLLLEMGGLAEEGLGAAVDALLEREDLPRGRADALEAEINALEHRIDERCLMVLALHQPVASELRFVAMAMKITTDLERIGDLAKNLARRSRDLLQHEAFPLPGEIPRMSRAVREMIAGALDAFVERDVERAELVIERDDEVDALHWQLYRRVIEAMDAGRVPVAVGLGLAHVVKDLERAADHASNIAEGVVYLVRGREGAGSGEPV